MNYSIDWEALNRKINNMDANRDYMLIDVSEEIARYICSEFNFRWKDKRQDTECLYAFRMYWSADFTLMDVYELRIFKNAGFHQIGKLSDYVTDLNFNIAELLDLLEV